MSRLHRLIHSLASGYLALAVAAIYSLATVPLAFQFLSAEQLGLWTLINTVAGYFGFLDLGISSAMSRFLIDVKDQKAGGEYGALIKTGSLVSAIQAMIIVITGVVFAPMIAKMLAISPELEQTCSSLIRWQTALLGFTFLVRVFAQMLHAHQRIDLYNYSQIAALLVSYFGLWGFLHAGQGVFSIIWTQWLGQAVSTGFIIFSCCRLRLFPTRRGWGRISRETFSEMFSFGKDVFLIAIGTQISMTCQAIVITRQLGLEAAAIWGLGTRLFSLAFQIIWRVSDFAAPALSEMMARHEQETLGRRYRSLFTITVSLAGLAAIALFLCNSLFVEIWTGGRIAWSSSSDVALAVWLVLLVAFRCHNSFIVLSKQIRTMHWVFLGESVALVTTLWFLAPHVGITGVIWISAGYAVLFSGSYGIWRIADYFKIPKREMFVGWLKPVLRLLAYLVPLSVCVWWFSESLSVLTRFVLHLVFFIFFGVGLWLRYGVDDHTLKEIVARLPSSFGWFARLMKIRG